VNTDPNENGNGTVPALSGRPQGELMAPLPGVPADASNTHELVRRINAVRRHKWWIFGLVVVGTALGVLAGQFIRPRYSAQATIWIEDQGSSRSGPIQTGGLLSETVAWTELLRSYVVLDYVVQERRLYLEPSNPSDSAAFADFRLRDRFMPGRYRLTVAGAGQTYTLRKREGAHVEAGRVGDPVGAGIGFDWTPDGRHLPAGKTIDFTVEVPREVSLKLAGDLEIGRVSGRNFMRLSMTGDSPQGVAGTLTAIVNRYVDVAAELKRRKLDELTNILAEQLTYAEMNMTQAERELESFRVQTITLPSEEFGPMTPGLQATTAPAFSNYFSLKLTAEQLRRDHDAIERAISGEALATEALEIIGSVRSSTALMTAIGELNNLRAQYRAASFRFTDEYEPVRRLLDTVRTFETTTIPQMARALQAELRNREAEIDRQIEAAGVDLQQIPPRKIDEMRMVRQQQSAEVLFRTLQQRHEEARLGAASSVPDVSILDEPRVPNTPVKGTTRLSLALMGFAGSLALGIALALVRDKLDPKLRYPDQVTTGLGLPILGGLPYVRNVRKGGDADGVNQMVEAFRSLRFNLIHAHGAAGPMVLTISSPGTGDGKSFVSSNLAVSFADLGYRTLLIDGDIRRGALHRLVGVVREPGLTDLLSGGLEMDAVVQATSYPRLHLISCGRRLAQGPELLGTDAMRRLIAEARRTYDVVLVDSPPFGAGVDPYVLSTVTGNLVVVLRTGSTDRPLTEVHLDMVDRLPIRVLGAVLNAVPATGLYRYYSYIPGYSAQDEVGSGPRAPQIAGTEADLDDEAETGAAAGAGAG
jgi:polysaccharide biosynthesis transport protein